MLASCLWCVSVKIANKGDCCWEMVCQLFCLVSSIKCREVFLQLIYMGFDEGVILRKMVSYSFQMILSDRFLGLWRLKLTQNFTRNNPKLSKTKSKKKRKKKHETFLSWPFNHLVTPYLGIRWRVPRFLYLFIHFRGVGLFISLSIILSIKFCNHLPLPLTVTSLFCSCFSTAPCVADMKCIEVIMVFLSLLLS